MHKGGRTDELKNYRPIAMINIKCKLCMLRVRERIDKWTEDSGMLGEIQGGFRIGRRTEEPVYARDVNRDGERQEGGYICGISGYGENL